MLALGCDSIPWFAIKATNTRTASLILETDTDNPDNYTTTTIVETDSETGEETTVETQVYNGPTLDVKDRLQNHQSYGCS